MNIYQTIKELAAAKGESIAELERSLDFSNGSLYKWTKTSPSMEKVIKVAKHFGVTTDYLLGIKKDDKDPISYFRIDTNGLDDSEIDDIKQQLSDYTDFLKQQLKRRHLGD